MRYSHGKTKTSRSSKNIFIVGLILAIIAAGLYGLSQRDDHDTISNETIKTTPNSTPPPETQQNIEDTLDMNKFEENIVGELITFSDWLNANNAQGYIGEVGWPDEPGWNALGDKWLSVANDRKLWVSGWAAGSHWGDYTLLIFGSGGSGVLDVATPQAEVWKPHLKDPRIGVNLAGLEFGTHNNFSSQNRGVRGVDYFSEPAESIAFLARQGVQMIRLPVRWERIQPDLNGPLDQAYRSEISAILQACESNNIEVIIDLHNYGGFFDGGRKLTFSDNTLTEENLIDVWQKMDQQFKQNMSVLAYGLMNEPKDEPPIQEGARAWEAVSQKTLTALRESGINTTILVAGYNWSKISTWNEYHPTGWIQDPLNNFRYEGHHYWDADSSGTYQQTYTDLLISMR